MAFVYSLLQLLSPFFCFKLLGGEVSFEDYSRLNLRQILYFPLLSKMLPYSLLSWFEIPECPPVRCILVCVCKGGGVGKGMRSSMRENSDNGPIHEERLEYSWLLLTLQSRSWVCYSHPHPFLGYDLRCSLGASLFSWRCSF